MTEEKDEIVFRPHPSFFFGSVALAVVTSAVTAAYVLSSSQASELLIAVSVNGLVLTLPFLVKRVCVRLTSDFVVSVNIRSRTVPYAQIRDVYVDDQIYYSPVVLSLKTGKRLVLGSTVGAPADAIVAEIEGRLEQHA